MASSRALKAEIGREIQKLGETTANAYKRTGTQRRLSLTGAQIGKGAQRIRKSLVVSGFELKCSSHFGAQDMKVVDRAAVVEEKEPERSRVERLLLYLDHLFPMMHPLGSFHVQWDGGMVLVILLCVVMTPFQIAFPHRRCVNPWTDPMELFNLVLDLILLGDCLITFNTAIWVNGSLITSRKKVAEQYVKGWFVLDFAASIPFNHLLHIIARGKIERVNAA